MKKSTSDSKTPPLTQTRKRAPPKSRQVDNEAKPPKKPRTKKSVDTKSVGGGSEKSVNSVSGGGRKSFGGRPSFDAKNAGSKQVPVGAPNCLTGKRFAVTGVMNGFSRDQIVDIIKEYGGDVKDVAKKTDFAVVGEDAGKTKLDKIVKYGIVQISEDQLLDMINSTLHNQSSLNQSSSNSNTTTTKDVPTTRSIGLKKLVSVKKLVEAKKSVEVKTGESRIGEQELWTEKYKPKHSTEIIENSKLVDSLREWLNSWNKKYRDISPPEQKRGAPKEQRAALLSGIPGIGKTSVAHLIARECGYDVVELNASDTRSAKTIKELIQKSTKNKSITEYFLKVGETEKKKICIVMDEVDGMSSGDRGGVAELVKIIKTTRVPIICICNDRSKQSLKTLISHSLDLKFSKPKYNVVLSRMKKICRVERLQVDEKVLENLVKKSNSDIRSILNNLQFNSVGCTSMDETILETKTSQDRNVFNLASEILSEKHTMQELNELYFEDSSLAPLFVQENYLKMQPLKANNNSERLELICKAAECISMGDTIQRKIMSEQKFELAPIHSDFSTTVPAKLVRGRYQSNKPREFGPAFPSVMGKMSTTRKNRNLFATINNSSKKKTLGTQQVLIDYIPVWRDVITKPMIESGKDGIAQSIRFLDEYGLTNEDLIALDDLSMGGNDCLGYKQLDTSTKKAFTTEFKKLHKKFTRASAGGVNAQLFEEDVEMDEASDEENEMDQFIVKQQALTKLNLQKQKFDKRRATAEKAKGKSTAIKKPTATKRIAKQKSIATKSTTKK